jgi:hypothetical protein
VDDWWIGLLADQRNTKHMLVYVAPIAAWFLLHPSLGSPLNGPKLIPPHPNRTEGTTMFAFRSLKLSIRENKYGSHSQYRLAHRFDRLKHPHSNPDLWHEVKDKCQTTWDESLKPDDHHFAATVDVIAKQINCWAAYHSSDVEGHEMKDGHYFVTYLPSIEALGTAPPVLWYTDKWDTHHHGPHYDPNGWESVDL